MILFIESDHWVCRLKIIPKRITVKQQTPTDFHIYAQKYGTLTNS